jgi:putative tricarboxylic transport membrane protein
MTSTAPASQSPPRPSGRPKSRQDLAAGLFLLAVAAVGFFGAWDLRSGTLGGMGPGLLPKAVAVVVAAFGLLLIVRAFVAAGETLERWSVRGPLFVLGAPIVFALTIREWGLVVAGPLAVLIAASADRGVRIPEVVLFAVVLTGFSAVLFKFILQLPIPLAPWYLGY